MLQIVIEAVILSFAFGAGLSALRHMNVFFRIIYAQLIVWIVFYILLHLLTFYQKQHGLVPNNQWLMNIHMVAETVLLATAAAVALRHSRAAVSAPAVLAGFILVFVFQVLRDGFTVYLNYADVAECIGMTVLYGLLLYILLTRPAAGRHVQSETMVCLGLLFYFAGSVPYLTMMHYIQLRDPELNHLLFDLISNVLAGVRYLSAGVAFLLAGRHAKLLRTTP